MQDLTEFADVPPIVVVERRRTPDRRAKWSGGRRDSDWLNRPPGVLARADQPLTAWGRWIGRRDGRSYTTKNWFRNWLPAGPRQERGAGPAVATRIGTTP